MKFIIQHNLINPDQLNVIKDAIKDFPHEFVGVIPFSHEITSDTPLDGVDYIPYGSTLLTNLAYERGWSGLHFDLSTFNYQEALDNRDDMLNMNVMRLDVAIDCLSALSANNPDYKCFVRPSEDLKQFSGQVIEAKECCDWFKSMMECETSGSYKLEPETMVVVSAPREIQAEWRWFIVGGKVISGSMYRAHGQMRLERVTEQKMIDEAQSFADKWLPDQCCVMDLALVGGELKVIEFNTINSSGAYDNDVSAIFKALWEYHNQNNILQRERYSKMQPFQQRVVDEKTELDEKLASLKKFFDTEMFSNLDQAERGRLIQQSTIMDAYSAILGERISAFS